MRRLACLVACLWLGATAQGAERRPLDGLKLFDWSSPGEPAYEALRQASAQARAQGWAAGRLAQGLALPQASARELALSLVEHPAVGAPQRQALAAAWAGEPAGLDLSPTAKALDDLEARIAGLNRRLDALEAAEKTNLYNSRSTPGFSGNFRGAWISGGGAGLVSGEHRGYLQGGMNLVFAGNEPGFRFELSPSFGRHPDDPDAPLADRVFLRTYGLGFSYGSADGAWDIQMGWHDSIQTSVLVGSTPQGLRPDSGFFLDLEGGGQPLYSTSDLTLDLPYGPVQIENVITLRRRTPSTWWPFTDTLLFYSQPAQLFEGFNFKQFRYGGSLRRDFGGVLPFLQSNALRVAATGYGNDIDRLRSFSGIDGFNVGQADRAHELAWAVGYENRFNDGTQFQAEFGGIDDRTTDPDLTFTATAHLAGYTGGLVQSLERRFQDTAWVATISRPLGPVSLGLEAAMVGPYFQPEASAVRSWMVHGVESNRDLVPATQTPWKNPPEPGGRVENGKAYSVNDDRDLRWGSDLSTPAALMSNSQRYALKGQGGWGWLNFGFAVGSAVQQRATAYWVRTSPFFESGEGGRLLYDSMSPVFFRAPAPFANPPSPHVGNAAAPSGTNPEYFQWKFNRPTDGHAVHDGAGNSFPAHWQALSQPSYRSLQVALLMTEGGLGDPRLAADSVKATNYAQLKLRLNLQDAFRRAWPAELTLGGELRDLAPAPGLPRAGEPGLPSQDPQASYLTQAVATGLLRWGLNQWLQILVSGGYERWRSDHGYLPLAIEVRTAGVGADLDLEPLLSGLGLFWRSRAYYLDDLNVGERALNLWENSVGTSLSF